ncbi:solute carrier family 49 member 4 homolog [Saccostrea echinata]|uniref:solute carrier family 49 member 4 homolog n=1 Tax=Saccostrea echinata TaxID=191078 RepID=UPI002A8166ED|nr:solute carrier family 49 member 4 homolog [Saccostrea echinata]
MSVRERNDALNVTVQNDGGAASNEGQPFLTNKEKSKVKTYKRRWYVLAVFGLASFLQAAVWNTWATITKSAEVVFGWEDSQFGMFVNWGNIAYIITVFPASYFMDTKGLRVSILICTALILNGTGVRCITHEPIYATWLMNLCAILNGMAGTVPGAGPAQVANTWFPPNQRASATAVIYVCNFLGSAMAFLIGPQLVDSPKYESKTHFQNYTPTIISLAENLDVTTTDNFRNASNSSLELVNFTHMRQDIMHFMYYEFAVAGLLFLGSLLMPSKPPTPPSVSASTQRVEYRKALLNIVRSKSMWCIGLVYGIPVYGAWGSVLGVILKPVGIGQTEVGWIGFYSMIAGCVAGLAVGRFSDMFMKHMKLISMVMLAAAGLSFLWFTLLRVKIIPFSTEQVYVSIIFGGMFFNGFTPLLYELGAEAAFPVSEGVACGFLTCLSSAIGILYLLLLQIPDIGTAWMNWTLVGSIGVSLTFLFIFPERYTRTDIDLNVNKTETGHPETTTVVKQNLYKNS